MKTCQNTVSADMRLQKDDPLDTHDGVNGRIIGKTRLDHVIYVDIWKEAHMYLMAEFLREKRLRWFGHVERRDKDEATRKKWQKKAKLRQTEAEMARPGERRYGQKPDDDRDGRRQNTLA